jgi:hypothetical protein
MSVVSVNNLTSQIYCLGAPHTQSCKIVRLFAVFVRIICTQFCAPFTESGSLGDLQIYNVKKINFQI